MFGTLPDLTPRDSHSLWYSSSRSPVHLAPHDATPTDSNGHGGNGPSRQRGQLLERTALHCLHMDEFWMARRKHNVANFGSHWLKPPGIPKTLHQLREERREHEEHQEALRREQLAQELAEAEAEAEGLPEEGMDDMPLDGAQDLDDEVPEAGDDFFMDAGDEEDEDEEEDEDDDGNDAAGEDADAAEDDEAIRQERHQDLVASRMRMTDDAFREALIRGDPDGDDMYGRDEELQEADQGHMLDEDDFGHDGAAAVADDGIDMDANLDDDIPEAASEAYEHTDSEAELSSSDRGGSPDEDDSDEGGQDDEGDDDDDPDAPDIGFAPRAAPLGPPQSPTLRGRGSLSDPRHSLDMSFLSQDESSFMESSPAQARRARHG